MNGEYMQEPLTHCPICKTKIDDYAECRTATPFTAYDPMEGLIAWGAYSAPKETVCYTGRQYIHFRTPGDERPFERLVFMTKAQSGAEGK